MIDFDTENGRMLAEHASGDSYRTIGRRHGRSHEGARQIVIRESTQFIDRVELDLYVAAKLESMGCEAEWPTFVIPFGEDWQTALSFFQWTVNRLTARDVHVAVRNRPTPAGHVFLLSLREESS